MAWPTTTESGRALAKRRWSKPEHVEKRVGALAEHVRRVVESLPPLTPEQRDRLAALLRQPGGAGDAA